MATKLFLLWLGLTMGLVIYAVFTSTPWSVVFERSFFQGFALGAAWFMLK